MTYKCILLHRKIAKGECDYCLNHSVANASTLTRGKAPILKSNPTPTGRNVKPCCYLYVKHGAKTYYFGGKYMRDLHRESRMRFFAGAKD